MRDVTKRTIREIADFPLCSRCGVSGEDVSQAITVDSWDAVKESLADGAWEDLCLRAASSKWVF